MGKFLIVGLLIAASAIGFFLYSRGAKGKMEPVSQEVQPKIQPIDVGEDLFDDPGPLIITQEELLKTTPPIFEVSPTPVEITPLSLDPTISLVDPNLKIPVLSGSEQRADTLKAMEVRLFMI